MSRRCCAHLVGYNFLVVLTNSIDSIPEKLAVDVLRTWAAAGTE